MTASESVLEETRLFGNVAPYRHTDFPIFLRNDSRAPRNRSPVWTGDLRALELCSGGVKEIANSKPKRRHRQIWKFFAGIKSLGLFCGITARGTIFIHFFQTDDNVWFFEKPNLKPANLDGADIRLPVEATISGCHHMSIGARRLCSNIKFQKVGRAIAPISRMGDAGYLVKIIQITTQAVHDF